MKPSHPRSRYRGPGSLPDSPAISGSRAGCEYGFASREETAARFAVQEGIGVEVADAVLPDLTSSSGTESLPEDPNDMLSVDERRQLASDLAKLATLRRDAETASGSLRLA